MKLKENNRWVKKAQTICKRKCNLGKVRAKLEETVGFTLAMSIVVLNLRKIQRTLSRLFLQFLCDFCLQKKSAFVQ